MVCDDSAVIRGLVSRTLEADPDIHVVMAVADGQAAINALANADVEVCILDIEMPIMDGLTALPHMIDKQPDLQVIVASTLTRRNAEISLKALSAGAADYIAKPTTAVAINAGVDFKLELTSKVKALGASRRRIRGIPRPQAAAVPSAAVSSSPPVVHSVTPSASATPSVTPAAPTAPARPYSGSLFARDAATRAATTSYNRPSTTPTAPRPATAKPSTRPTVSSISAPPFHTSSLLSGSGGLTLRSMMTDVPDAIAIGSSTGGPQALFGMLTTLGKITQPIFVTQHMPATFTTILAEHITRASGTPAVEAAEGMIVEGGKIYVAPGDFHMVVVGKASAPVIKLLKTPPENFCRPSVNPMLRSLVEIYGKRLLTVILTGMGQDGLKGGEVAVNAGGSIIAQDEATSVVWGMPGAVATAGLCSAILPLTEIAPAIRRLATRAVS